MNIVVNTFSPAKLFQERLDAFIEHANKQSEEYWTRQGYTFGLYPLRKPEFASDKWVKVYSYDRQNDGTETKQSIYAFIARCDGHTKTLGYISAGDIHKPASYQAPAKHARGNIFQENFNNCIGPIGIAYLR